MQFPDCPLCNRAACGANEELFNLLRSSPAGVDRVVAWWTHFKELRKIFRRSHVLIERCVPPVIESQGRDVVALRHLRQEVQSFYDAVAAHELVPEQRYVFACINDFLATIPSDSPLEDISIIMESFDNFTLAFHAMNQFPNARDRVDWIERYRRTTGQNWQNLEFQTDFLTEGTSALRAIRTSLLNAQPPPLGYCTFTRIVILV
jgi:hypothetical protein